MNRATEAWAKLVKEADRFPLWAKGAYRQVAVPKKELEEGELYVLEQKGEPHCIVKLINTFHDDPDNNNSTKRYKSDIINVVYRLVKTEDSDKWVTADIDEPLKVYHFDRMALDENDRHTWKKATFWKPVRLTGGRRKTRRSKRT